MRKLKKCFAVLTAAAVLSLQGAVPASAGLMAPDAAENAMTSASVIESLSELTQNQFFSLITIGNSVMYDHLYSTFSDSEHLDQGNYDGYCFLSGSLYNSSPENILYLYFDYIVSASAQENGQTVNLVSDPVYWYVRFDDVSVGDSGVVSYTMSVDTAIPQVTFYPGSMNGHYYYNGYDSADHLTRNTEYMMRPFYASDETQFADPSAGSTGYPEFSDSAAAEETTAEDETASASETQPTDAQTAASEETTAAGADGLTYSQAVAERGILAAEQYPLTGSYYYLSTNGYPLLLTAGFQGAEGILTAFHCDFDADGTSEIAMIYRTSEAVQDTELNIPIVHWTIALDLFELQADGSWVRSSTAALYEIDEQAEGGSLLPDSYDMRVFLKKTSSGAAVIAEGNADVFVNADGMNPSFIAYTYDGSQLVKAAEDAESGSDFYGIFSNGFMNQLLADMNALELNTSASELLAEDNWLTAWNGTSLYISENEPYCQPVLHMTTVTDTALINDYFTRTADGTIDSLDTSSGKAAINFELYYPMNGTDPYITDFSQG